MDGNKISDADRKCVEWTILFEVGTLVRNMDTMRIADMEASIFSKYVNIVHDIEDEHFESDSVRAKMLHRFKAGKQDLCVRNLLRRWKSENADFRSFWFKFLAVHRISDLPTKWIQSDQAHEEAVHCFSLGEGESGEILCCAVICCYIYYS